MKTTWFYRKLSNNYCELALSRVVFTKASLAGAHQLTALMMLPPHRFALRPYCPRVARRYGYGVPARRSALDPVAVAFGIYIEENGYGGR